MKLCCSQLNNVEKAVAAAHTFLKRNPDDYKLAKNMNYYKSLLDVEEFLIDHEEQPYEVGAHPSPTHPLRPSSDLTLTFSLLLFWLFSRVFFSRA